MMLQLWAFVQGGQEDAKPQLSGGCRIAASSQVVLSEKCSIRLGFV